MTVVDISLGSARCLVDASLHRPIAVALQVIYAWMVTLA
jgi:hypothetical protein